MLYTPRPPFDLARQLILVIQIWATYVGLFIMWKLWEHRPR